MAISSNEVSNIISGQVGMFSASAQYAQAISSQYGFQSGGSIGINDPRDKSGQHLQAGNMGAFGARMPGMAVGGLGLMAAFNYAPRMLDPFTSTLHAARMGHMGAGIGGAIGMGAMTAGAYMGIGMGTSFATGNMVTGAQNRGLLNSQIGGMFPQMNSRGLNMMAGQVEAMSRQGMGSIRELAALMQQGATTGSLDTGSLTKFSQSFRKLITNVRQVATVLNSTMTEASTAISQVKSMGIRSDQAVGFLGAAKGIGTVAHMTPQQMMGVARAGSQFGFSTGISRESGAMGAMVSAGVYNMARVNEKYGIDSGSQGRYTQAATRFLLSQQGRTVLGAMMTEEGEFDADRARLIARGGLGRTELRRMYNQNINSSQMRRHLRNRGTEIAGQFISQFGPESIAGSLDAMTSGSVDGVTRDSEMWQRSLTGLNRRDISSMRQLAANAPMLKQKLIDEARSGFREGQMRVSATQMMGIAFDKLIKPLKNQFRDMGASLTEAVSGAMEEVTGEFVKSRAPQGDIGSMQRMFYANQVSGNKKLQSFYSPTGDAMTQHLRTMPGRAQGWGSFANYLPSGLRMGAMPSGTGLDELPMGGLGTLDPNDGMAVGAFGLASRMTLFPGNRNFIGAAGAGMSSLGRGLNNMAMIGYAGGAAAPRYPWMGLTGVNAARGAARMPGGLLRFGGLMTRGIGALARFGSLPMMGYGMLSGGVQAQRMMGMRGISEGAFSGNNARLVHALRTYGALTDEHMTLENVKDDPTKTRESFPGTPVTGMYDADGNTDTIGGHQYFTTSKGDTAIQGLLGMSGRKTGVDLISKMNETDRSLVSSIQDYLGKNKSTPIADRMKHVEGMLKDKGIKATKSEVASLLLTQASMMGADFDTRREMSKELSIKDGKIGELLESINETDGFQVPTRTKDHAVVAKKYGTLLKKSPVIMNRAQEMFLQGNEDGAKRLVQGIVSDSVMRNELRFDDADGRNKFTEEVMKGMTGGGNLSEIVSAAAHQVDKRFGGHGEKGVVNPMAPGARQAMYNKGMTSMQNAADEVANNTGSVSFALEQGRRYLGMLGTDIAGDVGALSKAGKGHMDKRMERRNEIVEHLFNQMHGGNLTSMGNISRSADASMRGGTIGQEEAQVTYNAGTLLHDYNKLRKRKDKKINAKFLTKAGRRLGLSVDFSKHTSLDDQAYLAGTQKEGREHAMSPELDRDLRSFGRAVFETQNPGEQASEGQALEAAYNVVRGLQSDDKAQQLQAFQRLTTAQAPRSPSSGQAANGGLKTQVGQIDDALKDLETAIRTRAGQISGKPSN